MKHLTSIQRWKVLDLTLITCCIAAIVVGQVQEAATAPTTESFTTDSDVKSISLIGLGGMGKAIAKCFMKHGYTVHAWNRTPQKNRDWIGGDHSSDSHRLFVTHGSARAAILASNTTVLVINSAPHLKTVKDILLDHKEDDSSISILRGKTIVNMVNHDPYSGQDLDVMLSNAGAHHVAALLFGVPESVCSPGSHILLGAANNRPVAAAKAAATNEKESGLLVSFLRDDMVPLLQHLGQVHDFTSCGDVGIASVVYLCLVQSLYFGLAGYELSLLILQKYLASIEIKLGSESLVQHGLLDQYQKLASTLLKTFLPALLPVISNTIVNQEWTRSYVPAAAVMDMFELHDIVLDRLQLLPDSYHTTYSKYLRQTVETAAARGDDPEKIGVSAVVQHYSITKNDDSQTDTEL